MTDTYFNIGEACTASQEYIHHSTVTTVRCGLLNPNFEDTPSSPQDSWHTQPQSVFPVSSQLEFESPPPMPQPRLLGEIGTISVTNPWKFLDVDET